MFIAGVNKKGGWEEMAKNFFLTHERRFEMTDQSFITTFVIQGVGAVKIAGRHSHIYSAALRAKQLFIRIDDGDSSFIIPTPLILLCVEGRQIDDATPDSGIAMDESGGSGQEGRKGPSLGITH